MEVRCQMKFRNSPVQKNEIINMLVLINYQENNDLENGLFVYCKAMWPLMLKRVRNFLEI